MTIAALILAGGESKRFNSKIPKQFHKVHNELMINHSIKKLLSVKKISQIILVINRSKFRKYKEFIIKHKKIKIAKSGTTRALSVKNRLNVIKSKNIKNCIIHDAARPFFSTKIIYLQIKLLKKYDAVIPAIKSSDTIILNKKILPRDKCMQLQTPQAFNFTKIKNLHNLNKNIFISDDSSLFFQKNLPVKIIHGDSSNKKITLSTDLDQNNLYGIGYDIHKMILGRKLIIGGIVIPSKFGPIGHSDGDSLLHALIDSFLGAAKKGDIGTLFPNSKKFQDIDSSILVKKTIKLLQKNKLEIQSIDLNIILQSPNLTKYKEKIKNNLAKLCMIKKDIINIKAKTTDHLGIIGQNKALACEVISVLKKC